MPTKACEACTKNFYAKPSHIARGWARYCSKICQNESQKTGKIIKCGMCSQEIYRTPKHHKHSKSNKFFCSKSCQTLWRNSVVYVGVKHPNWKFGKHTYRNVLLKSAIPKVCKLCKTDDIRVLAVHHIDRNRNNNKIQNLVWLCHNCHVFIHHYSEEANKFKSLML